MPVAAWHSRGMSDAFDPRPPQELRAFYDRFSARFRAPGVRLCGFRLRWIAYRSEELDRGIERAVLDLAGGEEAVTRQAQFVARAREEADKGCGLTFVEVGLRRSLLCGGGEPLAPATVVLAISMRRCGHPCAPGLMPTGGLRVQPRRRCGRLGLRPLVDAFGKAKPHSLGVCLAGQANLEPQPCCRSTQHNIPENNCPNLIQPSPLLCPSCLPLLPSCTAGTAAARKQAPRKRLRASTASRASGAVFPFSGLQPAGAVATNHANTGTTASLPPHHEVGNVRGTWLGRKEPGMLFINEQETCEC
jgi:hypothetical protein